MTDNTPAESCMGETINTTSIIATKQEPAGSSSNLNHDFNKTSLIIGKKRHAEYLLDEKSLRNDINEKNKNKID